ncbi:hypothetical protein [Thalassotalea marina]|uniref:Phosphate ABC transporter substrate-binding protein n=1 Tax=Thalassotalea marina TaxID=1673741 RepID=A0A919EMW1_9GAMM|nr:hypothetical protein [Thalassotalea marina]GHG04810.1 hypothetical protein GCM10017161_38050 [Thalassotalea marina]
MRNVKGLLILVLWLFAPLSWGQEDMVVVMSKGTPIQTLSKSEVIDIFMGKYTAFPNGELAIAVELSGEPEIRQLFYKKLINRSLASVNAYWARLKFSGRKRSVVDQDSVGEVIAYLEKNPLAIGYIPISSLNDSLKVVYRLNE